MYEALQRDLSVDDKLRAILQHAREHVAGEQPRRAGHPAPTRLFLAPPLPAACRPRYFGELYGTFRPLLRP